MKYILEDEYEYDFELIGICCHEKDYRLCWAINNLFKIALEKSNECIEIILNKSKNHSANFSFFKYDSENQLTSCYLIKNKSDNHILISEKQHVDYLFMIKSSEKINYDDILVKLRTIPFVLTAHNIIVNQLKSKEYLIF